MGAVRSYNNDCRDCYYYNDNFYFARVDENGRDCYKCARCENPDRCFYSRYGKTCSNLLEIYDVEEAQRRKQQKEQDLANAIALGYLLKDDNKKYQTSDTTACDPVALFFGVLILWGYLKLFFGILADWSAGTHLILLGMLLAFCHNAVYNILGIKKAVVLCTHYCCSLVTLLAMMFAGVNTDESGVLAIVLITAIPLTFFVFRYLAWPFYKNKFQGE